MTIIQVKKPFLCGIAYYAHKTHHQGGLQDLTKDLLMQKIAVTHDDDLARLLVKRLMVAAVCAVQIAIQQLLCCYFLQPPRLFEPNKHPNLVSKCRYLT